MTLNTSGLDRFEAELTTAFDQGVEAAAREVLRTRNGMCPVDTGALLASGHVEQLSPATWRVVEGTGLTDARAFYTEYGTARMAAQPHMTPALTQVDAAEIVAQHIRALAGQSTA